MWMHIKELEDGWLVEAGGKAMMFTHVIGDEQARQAAWDELWKWVVDDFRAGAEDLIGQRLPTRELPQDPVPF